MNNCIINIGLHKTNKIVLVFCFFLLTTSSYSQAIIYGSISDTSIRLLEFYKAVNGNKVKINDYQLDQSRKFSFVTNLKDPGFYYLADSGKHFSYPVYLTPQEKLVVNLGEHKYDLIEGSVQNKLLKEWVFASVPLTGNLVQKTKDSIATEATIADLLQQAKTNALVIKQKMHTNDAVFDKLFPLYMNLQTDYAAMIRILNSSRIKVVSAQLKSFINSSKFTNASLLQFGECIGAMRTAVLLANSKVGKQNVLNLDQSLELIANDTLKGLYIVSAVQKNMDYDEVFQQSVLYDKYLLTESIKNEFSAKLKNLKGISSNSKGRMAYNFSLQNTEGKIVTMSDFKGKLVYVDVWATWCMPCRAEIPHLAKLEEELKGKEIEFVSVSIDVPEAKQKWLDFVKAENLGGLQLLENADKKFTDYYSISSIPRFLIFNKNGQIVSSNAPRPSQPELKPILTKLLGAN